MSEFSHYTTYPNGTVIYHLANGTDLVKDRLFQPDALYPQINGDPTMIINILSIVILVLFGLAILWRIKHFHP